MAPSAIDPVLHTTFASKRPPSSLSRKRANHEIGSDDNKFEAPAKRLKVAFDPEVEVRIVEDLGEKSLALVRAEIGHAIRQREAGQNEEFEHLKQIFNTSPYDEDAPSSNLLRKYLLGLTSNTVLLKRSMSDLVNAVLNYKWLGLDEDIVRLYTRFLGNLVSSHTGYLQPVVKMLVENFAHISSSAGHTKDVTLQRSVLRTRLQTALKYVHTLIPSSSGTLAAVFASSFPPPTDSKRAHIDYCSNLLRVVDYAPELKSEILGLIVERLIKIDVQVQVDIQDLEDDDAEAVAQGEDLETLPQEEVEDMEDFSDDASVSSDDSIDPEEQRKKDLKSALSKIDSILDLLFAFYEPAFSKTNPSELQATFDQLLSQFRKTILPTYRSRHTQFLLFHFSQKSPDLTMRFIDTCISILMDKARPSVLRVSAAAYIASFVSRGKHVDDEIVQSVVHRLIDYLGQLRKQYSPGCRGPDPRKYAPYYAAFQALMYIFCFRWRDLLVDQEDDLEDENYDDFDAGTLDWVPWLKEAFDQNVMNALNPLKVCAPEIVTEFTSIAHHLQFAYYHPKVETNKRIRLSRFVGSNFGPASRETALSHVHSERALQLEAYFPFDPYHLTTSKRWLADDYNEWRCVPGMEGEAEEELDDSSDEDIPDEDDQEEEGTETPEDTD